MPIYDVGLLPEEVYDRISPLERRTKDSETIRDLISEISWKYNADVVKFELIFDTITVKELNAPLSDEFLNKTVEEVIEEDHNNDDAEENVIYLTLKKYSGERKAKMSELKRRISTLFGELEAAKAAMRAAILVGGKRKTRRNRKSRTRR
jgi:hypothetical protein